jgi:hypothetical protein
MTTLLLIHIFGMVASLLATIYMVAAVAATQNVRQWFVRLNLMITSIGIVSGALLLINQPLGIRCMVLVAYLGVFAIAYHYVKQRSSAHTPVSVEK